MPIEKKEEKEKKPTVQKAKPVSTQKKPEKVDIWSEEAVSSTAAKKKEVFEKKPGKAAVEPKAFGKTVNGLELSEIIEYPLISEKSVGSIESQNKVTFVVNQKASKIDVKNAVEQLYAVKVDSVRTLRDNQGRKKAIVRLSKSFKAQELATKLGVV